MAPTVSPGFQVFLAAPRATCAGVERAIRTVELALDSRRPGDSRPIYVRHEIVHNRTVVEDLQLRGAVFVEETQDIPRGATAIFSAHGVSPQVREEAAERGLVAVDATCPLVARVHASARRFAAQGCTVLFVGHAGHPEVEGVLGEAPGHIVLVEDLAGAQTVQVDDPERVTYATQTTLSLSEVGDIVDALRQRFPHLIEPDASGVCYATTNRQAAVQLLVEKHGAQVVLVLGAPNSSNSNRLREVALQAGAQTAHLINVAAELDPEWLAGSLRVGVTAGASTPEHQVEKLVDRLRKLGASAVREVEYQPEDVFFAPPPVPGAPKSKPQAFAMRAA